MNIEAIRSIREVRIAARQEQIDQFKAMTTDPWIIHGLARLQHRLTELAPYDPSRDMSRYADQAKAKRMEKQQRTAEVAGCHYERWTTDEEQLILTSDLPDEELAIQLNRTMFAITTKRRKLNAKRQ